MSFYTAPPRSCWNISSGRNLKTANSMKETGTVTSKPMDGRLLRETSKQDSVGEITEKNIISTKLLL